MSDNNLALFNTFIVRNPLFPISDFLELFGKSDINTEELLKICSSKVFLEAIYLSSPSLYKQLEKLLSDKVKTVKEKEKLYITIFKFYSRMCCRCTPFGLFASIATGKFGESEKFKIPFYEDTTRITRLDMDCIYNLSINLTNKPYIRSRLKFKSNDSIYYVGDKIRCVEYQYINGIRSHHIFETERTEIVVTVLKAAYEGLTINDIKEELLIKEGLTEAYGSVVLGFIDDLIKSQLLVSELSPTTIGRGALKHIIDILIQRVPGCNELKMLQDIQIKLNAFGINRFENDLTNYNEIIDDIKRVNENQNGSKYFFQTDSVRNIIYSSLHQSKKKEIITAIGLVKKFTKNIGNANLELFKKEYLRRYDSSEIPLTIALDNEIGIGYGKNIESLTMSPLVDDLRLPTDPKNASSINMDWTRIDTYIFEKYLHAIKCNLDEIEITDDDINNKKLDLYEHEFPATFSALIQLFEEGGREKLNLRHAGGSSAINLISRFCYTDPNVDRFARKIADYEQSYYKNKIVAEINHLSESRIGNVLYRPQFRSFQISYLTHSDNSKGESIDVSDLYIRIKSNRIELFSKKYGKEIVPRMSTAHNYSSNSLPIYRFLCDLQFQNLVGGVKFDWGPLSKLLKYKPRVCYRNIIISSASWILNVKLFLDRIVRNSDQELLESVNQWRDSRNIPQWVSVKFGDNELVLNLTNLFCIKTLLSMINNRVTIELVEVLMKNSCIHGINGKKYSNEFIVAVKNLNNI